MGKCPECKTEDMIAIGIEKFEVEKIDFKTQHNWQSVGNKNYLIYVVFYCKKCDVVVLSEPNKIFG